MKERQLEFLFALARTAPNQEANMQRRFSEVLNDAVEYERGRGAKSLKSFIVPAIKVLDAYLGRFFVEDVTPDLIEQYQFKRRREVSAATVNNDFTVLSIAINRAIGRGWMKDNPLKSIKRLRVVQKRRRYLHPEEQEALIKSCDGMLKDAVIIALNTGMRRGEQFGLRVQDIDFKEGLILLNKTKTDSPRDIPMNKVCRPIFERRCEGLTDHLFLNRWRKPVKDLKKSFKEAVENAGLSNVRWHDLRHTFATNLLRVGVPMAEISKLLGHSRITVTEIYAKVTDDRKQLAVEALEGFLQRPREVRESLKPEVVQADEVKREAGGNVVYFPSL